MVQIEVDQEVGQVQAREVEAVRKAQKGLKVVQEVEAGQKVRVDQEVEAARGVEVDQEVEADQEVEVTAQQIARVPSKATRRKKHHHPDHQKVSIRYRIIYHNFLGLLFCSKNL